MTKRIVIPKNLMPAGWKRLKIGQKIKKGDMFYDKNLPKKFALRTITVGDVLHPDQAPTIRKV